MNGNDHNAGMRNTQIADRKRESERAEHKYDMM